MDYLTSGNACLKEGAFLIAWGAFFTSLGWVLLGFLLAKYGDINRWLSKVKLFVHIIIAIMLLGIFALIIIGLIKVGEGGTSMTKGWNELERYSQKKALIVALAREWLLNDLYTYNEPMSFDANDPNLGKEHFVYPEFRTSAQDRILISALFDINNRKDKKLIFSVFLYNDTIKKFNVLLSLTNEDCVRFPENVKQHVKQQKRKKVYLKVRDKAPLHIHFKSSHKKLLELLEKEYSWALIEARLTLANIHHLQEQQ